MGSSPLPQPHDEESSPPSEARSQMRQGSVDRYRRGVNETGTENVQNGAIGYSLWLSVKAVSF